MAAEASGYTRDFLLSTQNKFKQSPLHAAINSGNLEVGGSLHAAINSGNLEVGGSLHAAINSGNLEVGDSLHLIIANSINM